MPKIPAQLNDPAEVRRTFEEMGQLIEGMDKEYGKFWSSILDPLDPKKKNCPELDKRFCVHVEMDLMERLRRIGAIPAVFPKKDFESIGEPRKPFEDGWETCPREDWACQLLNAQKAYPREGWRIDITGGAEFIDELRAEMFEETLREKDKEKEDLFPYIVDRNEVTPSFDVPPAIDLSSTEREESSPPQQ